MLPDDRFRPRCSRATAQIGLRAGKSSNRSLAVVLCFLHMYVQLLLPLVFRCVYTYIYMRKAFCA